MENLKDSKGLYGLLFQRLEKIRSECHKEIVPFPIIFESICRSFSMKKQQAWEVLFFLRDLGLIEIVPLHGVRFKI